MVSVAVLLTGAALGVWLSSHGFERHPVAVVHHHRPVLAVAPTSLIASPTGPSDAFVSPDAASRLLIVPPTWESEPTSLPVIEVSPHWLEVRLLPGISAAQTAWLKSSDVSISQTPYRIVVDLASAHLVLYRLARPILCAPAGIGTATYPTPTGNFFVTMFAQAPSPDYGPFVMLTSAGSTAVTDWEQSGAPVVTIAGALGSSDLIRAGGARITTGAIRLLDADLSLLRPVPVGAPIDIVASPSRALARDERACGLATP